MSDGKVILVVDDDETIRACLCEFLEESGHRVLPATDGASALDRLRSREARPDLILMDLEMPVMNGWRLREEQLRDAALASIPVIVMTSARDLRGIAADQVLFKPLDLDALAEAIGRATLAPSGGGADVLADGGEMGALMRSIDWSATPLGPVSGWSPALRTMVGLLLRNRFPMLLWWGPRFVQLYNDAYRPIPGEKHPRAMGQPGDECWAEIWSIIGPMAEAPYRGGPATTSDDLCVLMHRRGFLEETHFKIAYSPVPDPTVPVTGIGGVLATVAETSEQVYGERQLRTLRLLGSRAAEARTDEQACATAAATLAENDWDVPFVLVYLVDEGARGIQVTRSAGLAPAAVPDWPIASIAAGRRAQVLELAAAPGLPCGRWSGPPRAAIALPLASPEQAEPYGVLVCGMSPHRLLDEGYRTFFELAAAQVVTAIRNARAYQQERRRAEALAEIDRAKTAFFSNVSHEFRTPLTLLLGPTEDLLAGVQGGLSDGQRGQLELVHRSALRLHKLVNALLDFSRIEAGRIQASYEPVDLARLTTDLASTFRSAIERAGLSLLLDCPPLDEPVHVDREMWEKVVLNLLSNAFKFTFAGTISVRLQQVGQRVELSVADTGVGIPAESLPRVFERFHRVEGTRSRTHEGSGIGLALVQELSRLHGGSVRAESRVGEGSTFTVSIPLGHAHLPADRLAVPTREPASQPASPPTAPPSAPAFVEEALRWLPEGRPAPAAAPRAGRILLADDNADMRDYVRRLLEPHWHVEAVEDGLKALESARRRRPDLVLTDVMMPGLDGMALLRELRADPRTRSIPVVMLSARAGEEARVEGLQAGAEDYLVKPFSARELLARVRLHLELARLREQAHTQQEHLYSLFMQAPVPIAVVRGEELVFEMANPRYLEVCGRSDILGKPVRVALPDLAGQGLDPLLREVLRSGRPVTGEEQRVRLDRTGEGHLQDTWWSFTYAPLREPDGTVDRVMAVLNEVTHRRAAEVEREAHLVDLERALAFSETFVGILGHDLRSPLGAIAMAADLILRRDPDERIARPLHRIRASTDRMSRMIEQVLDYTRARIGGGIPIRPAPIDLRDVAAQIVEEVEGGATQEVLFESSGDTRGEWDSDRIAQALSNLLVNAVEHGAQDVPVRLALDGADPLVVRAVVTNGGAVPPEVLPGLFDPFRSRTGPAAAARKSKGLGLGLYIVDQIVRAHGGTIEVASTAAEGTRITVTLLRSRA